jgi:hypothetical protein
MVESRKEAIPKPSKHDGSRFAQTSRNIDELRMAIRATGQPFSFRSATAFNAREATLEVVWRVARGRLEKSVELKPAHGSPLNPG